MTRSRTMFTTGVAGLAVLGAATGGVGVADAAVRPVRVAFDVRMLDGGGTVLRQTGSFAGAPFGRGRADIRSAVGKGRGAKVTFVLSSSAGTVRGTGDVSLTFSGADVRYAGTAAIVSGTGRFRGVHSRRLRFDGGGDMSGDHFRVTLSGRVAGL